MCCCEHQAEVASGDNVGPRGHKPSSLAPFTLWALPFQPLLPIPDLNRWLQKVKGFTYHEHQHPQPCVSPGSSIPTLLLPACIICCSRTQSSAPEIKLPLFGSLSPAKSQRQKPGKSNASPVTFTNVHNKLPAELTVPLVERRNKITSIRSSYLG